MGADYNHGSLIENSMKSRMIAIMSRPEKHPLELAIEKHIIKKSKEEARKVFMRELDEFKVEFINASR